MKKIKIIIILILVIVISLLSFSFLYLKNHNFIKPEGVKIYYTIQEGMTTSDVSMDLFKKKIIKNKESFYKLSLKKEIELFANITYELSDDMSYNEILNVISQPSSNFEGDTFLLYEGEKLDEVAEELSNYVPENKDEILDFWSNKNNLNLWIEEYDIIDDSILNDDIIYPLEGYLYPATYPIYKGESLLEITVSMLNASETNYKELFDSKGPKGDFTFHDYLTLASIVERETMHAEDRPKVAGVFYNRIEENMPLQSDITVLYAKGEHKSLVTYDDLEYNSPYNTYKVDGLPPGPISSVSLASLEAVYKPDNNDYLYFFAKQDTGEVLYAKTLEEHEKNSKEFAWE